MPGWNRSRHAGERLCCAIHGLSLADAEQAPGKVVFVLECGKMDRTFAPGAAENCKRFHPKGLNIMSKICFIPALAAFLFAVPATATDVSIVGLFSGKAVVTINGGTQKLLRAGEKTPEGVKLISADSNQAVLEIDGKQQSLSLGQGVSTGGVQADSGKASVTLMADTQGHFVTNGSINGHSTRFLVDTGASSVAMSSAEAQRLGIVYQNGERGYSSTANGVVQVYRVTLNNVKVGDISMNGVEAAVIGSSMPLVLLGMSFLNRVDMKREGSNMVLTKRF